MRYLLYDSCRDLSRLVAVSRDRVERAEFLDLCDVACDRLWCDEILVAKCRCYFLCFKMSVRGVALESADGSRMASAFVECGDVFD